MKKRINRGIVRPGQKTPFKKATQVQIESRINWIELQFRQGPIHKHQLMKKIKARFQVSAQTAEDYIIRARANLALRLKEAKDYHRCNSMSFYEGMILDKGISPRVRLLAQERIDKLLGLDSPQRIEHSGEMANITKTEQKHSLKDLDLDLETKKRILDSIRAKKADNKGE